MKFDNKAEKEVQITGEVQNNGIGIDTNNIDFIVTILSTNLYSKPIESFIRETVSNAWDSHVEAGVNSPVVLDLGLDTEGNYYCRVQDFGVGLSKERFNNIYKNIGSSTKRDTNGQIGGFGIGRFAALAYSDIVYITSIHEGLECLYMMYKDGNSISIDLLNEKETTERNGVEVKVPISTRLDVIDFERAIRSQLIYFENLYITSNIDFVKIATEFEEYKIKKFDNFWVNTLRQDSIGLVLGKVVYPLRFDSLKKEYSQRVKNNIPIYLPFEIGEIGVTPNREEILYTNETVDLVEAKLDLALEELDKILEKHCKKDFSSLSNYLSGLKHDKKIPIFENVLVSIKEKKLEYTYKGIFYEKKNFLETNDFIRKTWSPIKVNEVIEYGNLSKSGGWQNLAWIRNIEQLHTAYKIKIYVCKGITSLKPITRRYIRHMSASEGITYYFITLPKSIQSSYKEFLTEIEKIIRKKSYYYHDRQSNLNVNSKANKTLFSIMANNVSNIEILDDNIVSEEFIKQEKEAAEERKKLRKKDAVDWRSNVLMKKQRLSNVGYFKVANESQTHSLDKLRTIGRLCIYGDKTDKEKLQSLFLLSGGYCHVYEVAPSKHKLLKDVSNFVNIKDFMKNVEYKLMRNLATAMYIEKQVPHLAELVGIKAINSISKRLYRIIQDLNDFKFKYSISDVDISSKESIKGLREEIYETCKKHNYFNEEIKAIVDSNLKLLNDAKCLTLFISYSRVYGRKDIPEDRINVVVDYILARKIFRPDIPSVYKLKTETIFNINPEENEDNQTSA